MKEFVYILGLDIGKQSDPASLAVLRRSMRESPIVRHQFEGFYEIIYLKQWPRGTQYTNAARDGLAEQVCELVRRPPLVSPILVFDAGGVGEAFGDILRSQNPQCVLRGIKTHGGSSRSQVGDEYRIGKLDMLSALVALAASRRLVCAALPLAETYLHQVRSLQEKLTKRLDDGIDNPRDSTGHGDLAIAVAHAVWIGENTCIGWDGTIGQARSYAEGGSILSTAPPGVFNDMRGFKGDPPDPGRMNERDEMGLPKGYIPPWGPGW